LLVVDPVLTQAITGGENNPNDQRFRFGFEQLMCRAVVLALPKRDDTKKRLNLKAFLGRHRVVTRWGRAGCEVSRAISGAEFRKRRAAALTIQNRDNGLVSCCTQTGNRGVLSEMTSLRYLRALPARAPTPGSSSIRDAVVGRIA
jgi:hypothetical protein